MVYRYLEHLDSLRLGHAKRLMSWAGFYYLPTFRDNLSVPSSRVKHCFENGIKRLSQDVGE
jgi:hypothetical protein